MDSVYSFIGSFYHSIHSDFLAVTVQFYFVFFIFYLVKRHFNLCLCGCANISTYVCRYVSMQLCLYCQHLKIDSVDILMIKHSSYTKKILIQFLKKNPFLGLCFMICSKDFILETFQHDGTQQVDTGNFNNIYFNLFCYKRIFCWVVGI